MNDALPLPGSYRSSFLKQIRQTLYICPVKSDKSSTHSNATVVKGTYQTAETSASKPRNKAKRCLFSERKTKEIHFLKPTSLFRKDYKTGQKQKGKAPFTDLKLSFDSNKNDLMGEWSANVLRFLLHNTCSYSVLSLLLFVRDKGSVKEYQGTSMSSVRCP